MATLREIRGRITGIKKTQKITKAMKMVAAAKLRRAQGAVIAARPYARKIKQLLEFLSSTPGPDTNPLMAHRSVGRVAVVIVTADRGLCGAFNTNIIKAANAHIKKNYPGFQEQGRLVLFCVGKKGFDFFSKRGYTVAGRHLGIFHNLVFGQAQAIVREIMDGYLKGQFDRVDLVFNEFKSVAQQRIVVEQFLPIPPPSNADPGQPSTDMIFEPSAGEIMDHLVPRHLNFQVWRALLESNAAEQGARMAAMENATENAKELISTLQLQYNKARQASITKELLEIVGGAEALKAG